MKATKLSPLSQDRNKKRMLGEEVHENLYLNKDRRSELG